MQISVIVPCYNAGDNLARLLDSLLAQEGNAFEVILVDDASTDGSVHHLPAHPHVVRLAHTCQQGPAAARNTGARHARGEILLFIDSDSLVSDRKLLHGHWLLHQQHPQTVIWGGAIRGIGTGWVAGADRYNQWFLNIPDAAPRVGTHLVGNNLSVRRTAFNRLGGFDEGLRTGEDTDLCEWARRTGMLLGYQPSLVVEHRDRETLRGYLANNYRVGLYRVPIRKLRHYRFHWLLPGSAWIAPVYVLPLAAGITLQVMVAWIRYDPRVLFHMPLIFLGRLAMATGIAAYWFVRPRRPAVSGRELRDTRSGLH